MTIESILQHFSGILVEKSSLKRNKRSKHQEGIIKRTNKNKGGEGNIKRHNKNKGEEENQEERRKTPRVSKATGGTIKELVAGGNHQEEQEQERAAQGVSIRS